MVQPLFLEVIKICGCSTCGHGLVENTVVDEQLDSMILKLFPNLNDSMILRICCSQTALAFHDYSITIQNENNVYLEELSKAAEFKEKMYCFKSSSLIYHIHYYIPTTDK